MASPFIEQVTDLMGADRRQLHQRVQQRDSTSLFNWQAGSAHLRPGK